MAFDSVVFSSRSFAPADGTAPSGCTALSDGSSPLEPVHEVHELAELLRLVDDLPTDYRPDFYKVLDRLAACVERRQRMLGYVQDSLNQMSLDLKYLIFDLEATRRERDEYRSLLDPPII